MHLKRNVEDAHAYINPDKKDHVISKLNSYHNQRQYEKRETERD